MLSSRRRERQRSNHIYKIRAAAGTGSACGLGASPTRTSGSQLALYRHTRKYRRAAHSKKMYKCLLLRKELSRSSVPRASLQLQGPLVSGDGWPIQACSHHPSPVPRVKKHRGAVSTLHCPYIPSLVPPRARGKKALRRPAAPPE
jgi:hypothetical protein